MKKMIFLAILTLGLSSCSNEEIGTEGVNGEAKPRKGGNSSSAYEDYNVVVTQNGDGSLWTYTITKANAKNLSHFIINLGNCGDESATYSDVIWATVNGVDANMSPTEGSGTGCNPQASTTNFIKFNIESGSSWVIVIKFDRGYYLTPSTSWAKAGTSCNTGTVDAPGCPREDYCSFSQCFYFAGGNNDSYLAFVNGLTIGGITYTREQALAEWDVNTGQGGDAAMRGFFQLGALLLSELDIAGGGLTTQASLIETYFTGLNVTTAASPLPDTNNGVTKEQVSAAAGQIGNWIDENHCQ